MADSADSIKKYREVLELDPGSRVFAMLAEELCAVGRWEEAAEVCKKGLPFHPDHLAARMLLGRALMEMGDHGESERVLCEAVEEIRKNSVVFKLLSELSEMSGKTESAAQYARVYEAFHTSGHAEEAADLAPVAVPEKEVSQWDDFKAEAIENLDADSSDVEKEPGYRFEDVLIHLAQRLDGRLSRVTVPVSILSENDKELLKERIVALLGA